MSYPVFASSFQKGIAKTQIPPNVGMTNKDPSHSVGMTKPGSLVAKTLLGMTEDRRLPGFPPN